MFVKENPDRKKKKKSSYQTIYVKKFENNLLKVPKGFYRSCLGLPYFFFPKMNLLLVSFLAKVQTQIQALQLPSVKINSKSKSYFNSELS